MRLAEPSLHYITNAVYTNQCLIQLVNFLRSQHFKYIAAWLTSQLDRLQLVIDKTSIKKIYNCMNTLFNCKQLGLAE